MEVPCLLTKVKGKIIGRLQRIMHQKSMRGPQVFITFSSEFKSSFLRLHSNGSKVISIWIH